jgi:hypothetical protein
MFEFIEHTFRDYPSQITITHRQVWSVTVFTDLLGNVFEQLTFLDSSVHGLAGWQSSHQPLTLITAVSSISAYGSWSSLHSFSTDRTRNAVSNIYSIVAYYTAVSQQWLHCEYAAMCTDRHGEVIHSFRQVFVESALKVWMRKLKWTLFLLYMDMNLLFAMTVPENKDTWAGETFPQHVPCCCYSFCQRRIRMRWTTCPCGRRKWTRIVHRSLI